MSNKNLGLFITIEGGDGSGKTTIINEILPRLIGQHGNVFVLTREPGGNNVKIAEQIREIVLSNQNRNLSPETEAYLFAASRAQHMSELIIPELNKGKVVISDRFIDSSLVYQGIVKGLGIEEVLRANELALKGRMPDLTIILSLPPDVATERISIDKKRSLNRLDQEPLVFHEEIQKAYQKLTKMFPQRIKMVNANISKEKILELIFTIIDERVQKWRKAK